MIFAYSLNDDRTSFSVCRFERNLVADSYSEGFAELFGENNSVLGKVNRFSGFSVFEDDKLSENGWVLRDAYSDLQAVIPDDDLSLRL